jgi:hypothetical protein
MGPEEKRLFSVQQHKDVRHAPNPRSPPSTFIHVLFRRPESIPDGCILVIFTVKSRPISHTNACRLCVTIGIGVQSGICASVHLSNASVISDWMEVVEPLEWITADVI